MVTIILLRILNKTDNFFMEFGISLLIMQKGIWQCIQILTIIQAGSISLLRCNDNIILLGHTYHKVCYRVNGFKCLHCLSFLQDGVDQSIYNVLKNSKFKLKNPIFLAMVMISRICSIYIGTSITRILITINIYNFNYQINIV